MMGAIRMRATRRWLPERGRPCGVRRIRPYRNDVRSSAYPERETLVFRAIIVGRNIGLASDAVRAARHLGRVVTLR